VENEIVELKTFLNEVNDIRITIDGPSGVGKGTIAKKLGELLNITHISVGEVFRTVAYSLLNKGISLNERDEILRFLKTITISFTECGRCVIANETSVRNMQSSEIADVASKIAADPLYHMEVTKIIRTIKGRNLLIEGRATGSYILPKANVKFFLDATINKRVERKGLQLGLNPSEYPALEEQMLRRDKRDLERKHAPLLCGTDFICIDSSMLAVSETIAIFFEELHENLIGIELQV